MTFSFADDTPAPTTGRSRRSRGQAARGGSSRASSMSAQSSRQQQQHHQLNFSGWDDAQGRNNNIRDDNSCAGSLEYSATSSVLSAGSASSGLADIYKVFDSEVNSSAGSSEVREFIARQSQAASGGGSGYFSAAGGGQYEREDFSHDAAVQGWMERVENRQAVALQQMKSAQAHKTRQQQQFASEAKFMPPNELNYSINESESDEVFEVDFDGNVLETIGGHDDDNTNDAPADHQYSQERYQAPSLQKNSRRSAGKRPSRHVTPPPNSRRSNHSTTPASSVSPASSQHSKSSSSDGSMDTPVPSSPPRGNGLSGAATRKAKPPSRSLGGAPAPKPRRNNTSPRSEQGMDELSNAFYSKAWMGGFADSFDFDSEPAFPTP